MRVGKIFPLLFLLVLLPAVSASVSVQPENIDLTLGPFENRQLTVTLAVENASYSDVQVLIVGDTPSSELALRQMVSLFPSYFAKVENESKSVSVSVSAVSQPGTYTGLLRFTSVGLGIPVRIKVLGEVTGGGLVPDRGSVVVTLPAGYRLQKAVNVYNFTGETVVDFGAEMEETEIYTDADWFQVEYDAPYQLEPNRSVQVKVTVDTTGVPTGVHTRSLKFWAFSGSTRFEGRTTFRVTVRAAAENRDNSIIIEVPSEGYEPTLTVRATRGGQPAPGVSVYLDGSVAGTTDSSGYATLTVSRGRHTVSAGGSSRQVTVYARKQLSVQVTASRTRLSGTVTCDGAPVGGCIVSAGGRTTVTDQFGRFEMEVPEGSYVVTATKRDEQEAVYYAGVSQQVEAKALHLIPLLLILVFLAVAIFLIWKRELVARFIEAHRGVKVPK